MNVMTIEYITKIPDKGITVFSGILECDVKPNDEIEIITNTQTKKCKIWSLETFREHMLPEAKKGQGMGIAVRGIIDLDLEKGNKVVK